MPRMENENAMTPLLLADGRCSLPYHKPYGRGKADGGADRGGRLIKPLPRGGEKTSSGAAQRPVGSSPSVRFQP